MSETNSAGTNSVAVPNSSDRITAQKVVAARIHEFIQNTRSGALGLAGMLVLVDRAQAQLKIAAPGK